MTTESLTAAILAHAATLESRLGPPPASDPSLEHARVDADPVVHQIVYSMLLWEASHEMAARSLELLRQALVDYNELRVCSPVELRDMLPKDLPRRDERTSRMLAALNAVFVREHGLNLTGLTTTPKREARQYLDSIDGLPQFAAARVMLVSLGGHAFPADERICQFLRKAGLIESDGAHSDEVGARLERAVRAADAPRVYALIEAAAAASDGVATPRRRSAVPKPGGARRGGKKS